MDINDIIDSIYKLPDASKEALLSDAPEVAYPKGFHLFRANHKSSKFYLMKKGMLHAYTHQWCLKHTVRVMLHKNLGSSTY